MTKTNNMPVENTFHSRKAERTKHYEEHVKGWRLQVCGACNGTGKYDHNGSPDCGACDGTGKTWGKPNCITDIEPLLKTILRMEPSESVALHIFIRNRREVIYQYSGLDDKTKDPPLRTKLHTGYDTIDNVEDWYFEDKMGGQFFLHQFEPVT